MEGTPNSVAGWRMRPTREAAQIKPAPGITPSGLFHPGARLASRAGILFSSQAGPTQWALARQAQMYAKKADHSTA
ncbi:MAG: hypothetical protein AMXMBFR60_22640 [Chloroflexota bacterium]